MLEWWQSLMALTQFFFCAALFFSVFSLWQVFVSFGGIDHPVDSGDGDVSDAGGIAVDAAHDGTYDHFEHGVQQDAAESLGSFKIISLRSLVTFFTLFCWSNALFLSKGTPVGLSMVYSMLWGVAGMVSVAWVFYALIRLSETGTSDLATCVGTLGMVYQDIPAQGVGRVRTVVSGTVAYIKAMSPGDEPIPSGTQVRVLRKLDSTVVEVEKAE